ncbi:hypothetical protein SISNIDRAFT_457142 [Sistotremastrum niveocremeum HHB9708]|uniref:Uncharacterized protein n=1 Tax=Sistotremastrum niveocremeum HHB9708 TaxID=1314777 RepID=A0A164S4J1_9AGAM|nr:hypothetical protein SISNIDRAFT_457142 [Sistotremastrum niveocremeum HHB9708]
MSGYPGYPGYPNYPQQPQQQPGNIRLANGGSGSYYGIGGRGGQVSVEALRALQPSIGGGSELANGGQSGNYGHGGDGGSLGYQQQAQAKYFAYPYDPNRRW